MTAEEIVTRIQEKLLEQGIAWRAQTVDTFKAGSPATDVKGIATTGMATFDVLRRVAAAGKNFVITHEPTFYNDKDIITGLAETETAGGSVRSSAGRSSRRRASRASTCCPKRRCARWRPTWPAGSTVERSGSSATRR